MDERSEIPHERRPVFDYPGYAAALDTLGTVANRLRHVDEWSRRLALEGSPISAVDYLARLRKRKNELSRAILEARSARIRPERPATVLRRSPWSDIRVRGPVALEPHLAGPHEHVGPSCKEYWEAVRGECRTYEGSAPPGAWWQRECTTYVKHDSTCGFAIDDRFFLTTGGVIFHQTLDDDASIWRDDNPDSYRATLAVGWELPRPNCDVQITCRIAVQHHVDFTNGADDGGHFATTVAMVHSDPDGNFGTYNLCEIQFLVLGNLGGENLPSGTYDSGAQFSLEIQFGMPKDSTPRVCLGHHCFLIAQDGLVDLLGTLGTHGPYGFGGPPLLSYSMVPDA